MTRVPELLALAQRCEEATGPDREIDIAICKATRPDLVADLDHCNKYGLYHSEGHFWDYRRVQFTASLDAALSLAKPPGSPLWTWTVNGREDSDHPIYIAEITVPSSEFRRYGRTPALALCAASLTMLSQDGRYERLRARAALDQPA